MTVPAHEPIAWLHPRMPLALREPAEGECWLTGSPDEAMELLVSREIEYKVEPSA